MATNFASVLKVLLPKRSNPTGNSFTNTFNPTSTENILSLPGYRDHMTDIFTSRSSDDSRVLMKSLFIHDPDVSAAVNAFLTVANTDPVFIVRDVNGMIDREGQKTLNSLLMALTTRFDYSKGFDWRPSIRQICENMRYMILLRGAVAQELVVDKALLPTEIRHVDISTVEWFERTAGKFTPRQKPANSQDYIDLNIPTFFVSFYRRDPTSIYTFSPFVSAINTVAARQQVINDLYRIMQLTGYPRLEITVLEEVLKKNAPASVKQDPEKLAQYINTQITSIRNTVVNLRPDQTFVHTDSVESKMLNDSKPASALNIDSIIGTLNAQNQAALRSVATILGRGESGVNTASVEARIFSMNAEEINEPLAEVWSQMMTMLVRLHGHEQSTVSCRFKPVELRPSLELEPQMMIRSTRLKQDLSLGIINDDEYHLEMYGRIRPDDAPELGGTGFADGGAVDVGNASEVSPNADPLGRSLAPSGSEAAQGNAVNPAE
jgi:hypothetical protein